MAHFSGNDNLMGRVEDDGDSRGGNQVGKAEISGLVAAILEICRLGRVDVSEKEDNSFSIEL